MKCPRKDCNNEANESPTYGILPCVSCQEEDTRARLRGGNRTETVRESHRLQEQRDKHSKDLLQPFVGNKPNREFAEAYPNRVKDHFTKSEIKKF